MDEHPITTSAPEPPRSVSFSAMLVYLEPLDKLLGKLRMLTAALPKSPARERALAHMDTISTAWEYLFGALVRACEAGDTRPPPIKIPREPWDELGSK